MQACAIFIFLASFVSGELDDGIAAHAQHEMQSSLESGSAAFEPQFLELDRCEATVKAKMEELGMEKNPNYKLCFYLDNLAMITVHAPKYGVIDVSFPVKSCICVLIIFN